jgi:hypothetical protein
MAISYNNPLFFQTQNSFLTKKEEEDEYARNLEEQTKEVFPTQTNQVVPNTLPPIRQTQDILRKEGISSAGEILKREGITSPKDILQREGITSAKDVLRTEGLLTDVPRINIQDLINKPPPIPDTPENAAKVDAQLKSREIPPELRTAFESSNLTADQYKTIAKYFGNEQLVRELEEGDIKPTVNTFVDKNRTGYEFATFAATRVPKYGGSENIQEQFGKLGALTAQYIGTVAEIKSYDNPDTPGFKDYYYTKPDGTLQPLTRTDTDTYVANIGNFYGEGKQWYTAGIEFWLDPETNEFKINKPTVNAYMQKSGGVLKQLAPMAMMVLMPYAGAVGSSLFGLTGAAATAAGAATISAGVQLAATGKIDPLQVAISAGSGYVGYNAGLTGADIAADASQLIGQGLSASQAASTIAATGVNSVTATVAANLAAAGVPASMAPTITAATINMGFSGLVAAASGGDISDALTRGALAGAGTSLSTTFMDNVVGIENINSIAKTTGLSAEQVRGIGAIALSEGISAEVSGSNNFISAVKTSLVANGFSYKAANQMTKSLNSNISPQAKSAIFNATRETVNVATRAAIGGRDVDETIKTMAPFIAARSITSGIQAGRKN